MPDLPLDGVLVVACEQAVAAPLATRHLADLGARVIKVERPGGDFARRYDETVRGLSSHFVWLNRGKESVVLDLRHPDDTATLDALLARADVFVQNLAPGAAERLGIGAPGLRARFPRLITCSISGYGEGPYRDAKAYDLLVQSEAGVVAVTGTPEQPAKAGIPVADIGGGMYAFAAILAALYERERTGSGAALEVSLFDALVEWMGYPLLYTRYGGSPPPRAGTDHAAIAPYGTFRAGDGTEVVVGVQNDGEWHRFCTTVLLEPSLAVDPRYATNAARVASRPALHQKIEAVLSGLDGTALLARLQDADVPHARRRDVADVLVHPQLAARWQDVDTPAGLVTTPLPPIRYDGRRLRTGRVPEVGEHTEAIKRWLSDSG